MTEISPLRLFAAFAAVYLIWGSTYFAILVGLESIPPVLLAGLRFTVAGALLAGWCLLRGERSDRASTFKNAFAGTLMSGAGTGAVIWAEQFIPSGTAAIIVAGMPFWFVLFDRPQWASNFSKPLVMSGIAIGFVGILLLFGERSAVPAAGVGASAAPLAMVVLVAGCLCWAMGSIYIRYNSPRTSSLMNAGIQMLAPGLLCLFLAWPVGEWAAFSWAAVSGRSWLGMGYLVFLGSMVGYLSFVWLLSVRPAAQVGTYAYVNPVVAVLLGWVFAGEALGGREMAALGVILAGVLLINLPKYFCR